MTTLATPISEATNFASQIDAFAYGEYPIAGAAAKVRQLSRFDGRLTADGSGPYPAEAGRYHLYGGRFCPRSHRATLVIALAGLTDLVTVSHVDGLRDGRGWAFRERTGPDPVNGFTLLRQAYQATDPSYAGDAAIPVLWDRKTNLIVTNNADTIDVDLATAFGTLATEPTVELYPIRAQAQIDTLNEEIAQLDVTITRAVYDDAAKRELRATLRELDRTLAGRQYLLGDALTLADLRLWVLLVRYDAGPNANGAAGPKLTSFGNLWRYARGLYGNAAFRETTDFTAFKAPLSPLLDWTAS